MITDDLIMSHPDYTNLRKRSRMRQNDAEN